MSALALQLASAGLAETVAARAASAPRTVRRRMNACETLFPFYPAILALALNPMTLNRCTQSAIPPQPMAATGKFFRR